MSAAGTARDIPVPPAHFRRGAAPDAHQSRRAATVLDLSNGLSGVALDYGSGWGDLTAHLAPRFTRIIGVDADPDRVAFATREFAPIEFRVCDADRLECSDATFDVVYSIAVLPFVPSPDAYLAECRRVLRPSGTLVVMIGNPESMWMVGRRLLGRRAYRQEWGGESREEFREYLERSGFMPMAEAGFYDPPLDRLRSPGDLVVAAMNAAGHVLRIPGHWSYVGYRCQAR